MYCNCDEITFRLLSCQQVTANVFWHTQFAILVLVKFLWSFTSSWVKLCMHFACIAGAATASAIKTKNNTEKLLSNNWTESKWNCPITCWMLWFQLSVAWPLKRNSIYDIEPPVWRLRVRTMQFGFDWITRCKLERIKVFLFKRIGGII